MTSERHLLQRQLDQFAPVWERRSAESPLWFGRFLRYLELGPNRSLLAAVNAERLADWEAARKQPGKGRNRPSASSATPPPPAAAPPGSWKDEAARMQWRYRARQFDEYRLIEHARDVAEEREGEGIARRAIFRQAREALGGELARMTGGDGKRRDRRLGAMRGIDVITAIKTITDLQRTEYGDLPPVQRLAMTDAAGNDVDAEDSSVLRIDLNLLTVTEAERLLALLDEIDQRTARARIDAAADAATEGSDGSSADGGGGEADQPDEDDGETF